MKGAEWMAAAATIVAAIIGMFSAIKVRNANKRVDEATARKSDAEAASFEVKTARDLLQDVQQWSEKRLVEVRSDYEQRITALRERHDSELKTLQEGQADLTEQFRALRAAFAAHETWDADAVALLRTIQPQYPAPPAIHIDDIDDIDLRRRRARRRAAAQHAARTADDAAEAEAEAGGDE